MPFADTGEEFGHRVEACLVAQRSVEHEGERARTCRAHQGTRRNQIGKIEGRDRAFLRVLDDRGRADREIGLKAIDRGDIRIVLNELGTVTSLDTVTVMTQINGQLVDVGFKEGQAVAKGDFLAQIDPRPYQVALEQAQGQLAHDQGLLGQAQSDLKRYQTLGRQDSIAQQQVEDQRYLVAQYTGLVQSDQAQVDNARLNLTYCHIVAPVDGQVGLRQVDPGNMIHATDANGLIVIAQLQLSLMSLHFYLIARVPLVVLASITLMLLIFLHLAIMPIPVVLVVMSLHFPIMPIIFLHLLVVLLLLPITSWRSLYYRCA